MTTSVFNRHKGDRQKGIEMKSFENLLRSEVRRVERFAQRRDGKDSRLTGYSSSTCVDDMGFVKVRCEICSNDMTNREDDVVMYVFLPDRRRSFISNALSHK